MLKAKKIICISNAILIKKKKYGVFLLYFLKKCLVYLKINKMFKNRNKDYFLRKQYQNFEIWNILNKSFKKSQLIYNIPSSSLLKKKNIVKLQFVIIVFRLAVAAELFLFFGFLEC